ncbi:hypothetical protein OH492_16030 [Vibrio chagasii]|nr:hypothetical protein [Vibrio chagasii]
MKNWVPGKSEKEEVHVPLNRRILIVEDNLNESEDNDFFLEQAGYEPNY